MLISVAAMLIESASLETTTALVYIICVGVGSPLQNIFLPVLSQVQVHHSPVIDAFGLRG